ncbi:MAG: hypothetical protein EOO52_19560 [Gammaproteobacteria bacterium]|nr:MAG: hypothetical protein EOO52_19560 [Gammaproteobacteria bacterium]
MLQKKNNTALGNEFILFSQKYLTVFSILLLLVSCGGGSSHHQNSNASSSSSSSASSVAVISTYNVLGPCAESSPYTLTITNGNLINSGHLEKMICNFFATYPKIVELLNPNASKTITFTFSPGANDIAAAYGTNIVYLTSYLAEAPDDVDIVVHETTHAAQAELVEKLPRWIIEGTADFIRDLYGLDSKNIWSIPRRYVDNKKHYTNGYGDAAGFFKWIDAIYRQNQLPVAAEISRTTLTTPYTDDIWVALTGKSLDALWNEYVNFPVTPPYTTGVSVFNGANFTGYEVKLERGNYDLQDLLSLGVTDNQIASIKIPDGYKVKVYVDINFAGEQKVFTSTSPVMDEAMLLKISSLIVE